MVREFFIERTQLSVLEGPYPKPQCGLVLFCDSTTSLIDISSKNEKKNVNSRILKFWDFKNWDFVDDTTVTS